MNNLHNFKKNEIVKYKLNHLVLYAKVLKFGPGPGKIKIEIISNTNSNLLRVVSFNYLIKINNCPEYLKL